MSAKWDEERRYSSEESAHLKRIFDDYQRWANRTTTPHPNQPEPDYYSMAWQWPAAWGEPVERFSATSAWGHPCEVMLFANGERVRRLSVPFHGYD